MRQILFIKTNFTPECAGLYQMTDRWALLIIIRLHRQELLFHIPGVTFSNNITWKKKKTIKFLGTPLKSVMSRQVVFRHQHSHTNTKRHIHSAEQFPIGSYSQEGRRTKSVWSFESFQLLIQLTLLVWSPRLHKPSKLWLVLYLQPQLQRIA